MALTRQEKERMLQEYADKLQRAQVVIWADYRGTTVPQLQELRGQLRPCGAEAVVVKNTIMRLALERLGLPVSTEVMAGPSAVALVYDNVPAATKVVTTFASANEHVFRVKGGMAGGRVISVADVAALSTLPSREVLLARVLGSMQAPISGLVGTLAAVMRGLMNVLNARAEQLEGAPS